MAVAEVVFSFLCLMFISSCQAFGLFDDIIGDASPCEETCQKTFPLHTYDKATHLNACFRGCRFYFMIDFVEEYHNVNQTLHVCSSSCQDAYPASDNKDACAIGCEGQVTTAENRRGKLDDMRQVAILLQPNPFYPLLYVHNIYSNMIDKFNEHMTVSWSFYIQNDNGKMVVIRQEPTYMELDGTPSNDYKTANYIETNLAGMDDAATPDLMRQRVMPRSMESNSQSNNWLECIAKKTGLSRLLLALTLLVSAMMMVWLCASTVATAPEQRLSIKPQKLSIYGDLEYLREMDDAALLAATHPQEKLPQATPLPIKIRVQSI